MANSTLRPAKPRADFPLFPHASGRWAKKVKGNFCYFGKVADDPNGERAINLWLDQRDELLAGRKPRAVTSATGLTVKELCNRFIATKAALQADGELSLRTLNGYHRACKTIIKTLGKSHPVAELQTSDFEAMRVGAFRGYAISSRSVLMQQVRTVFRYAYDEQLIDRPIRFGQAFKAPSAKTVLKDTTARKKARELTAEQIHALMDGAGVYLRAMILLGINCGFGNYDCATLPFPALDLEGGWVKHARPKTGIERKAKLWPETVDALRKAIEVRRKPKDAANANLIFITQTGQPWVRWAARDGGDPSKSAWTDSVTIMARLLFRKLGINGGASFYSLRRMTETIGGRCRGPDAVDVVMGHKSAAMGETYRLGGAEGIGDDRLGAVADVIHAWLFPTKGEV